MWGSGPSWLLTLVLSVDLLRVVSLPLSLILGLQVTFFAAIQCGQRYACVISPATRYSC